MDRLVFRVAGALIALAMLAPAMLLADHQQPTRGAQVPPAQAGDVMLSLANHARGSVSIQIDPAVNEIRVRSFLSADATMLNPGEFRHLMLSSGNWQLVADGVPIGGRVAIGWGRSYSLELFAASGLDARAIDARLMEDQRVVQQAFLRPATATTIAYGAIVNTTPVFQVRFTCMTHGGVLSDRSGACPICGRQLVERSVMVSQSVPGTTLLYVCPRHADVRSSFPGDCWICRSQLTARRVSLSSTVTYLGVSTTPYIAVPGGTVVTTTTATPASIAVSRWVCADCGMVSDVAGRCAGCGHVLELRQVYYRCPRHAGVIAADPLATCALCGGSRLEQVILPVTTR